MTYRYLRLLRSFLRDRSGQDMVEYALLAGFVAVAAGATLPGVAEDLGTVYSKVQSITAAAAADKRSGSPTSNDNPTGSQEHDPGATSDGSPSGPA